MRIGALIGPFLVAVLVGASTLATSFARPASAASSPPPPTKYLAGSGAIGSVNSYLGLQLVEIAGTSSTVLVPDGAKNPDVNQQHTQIVFERYPGYTWLMNTDGSNLRPLSGTTAGGWMEPRFAPDGRTVILTHDMGAGFNEIFSIDSVTGAATQLTNTGTTYPWKWRPSVDPTGTQLIVTYGVDSNPSNGLHSHIGMAKLGRGMITSFTDLTPVNTSRPSFDGEYSPDGRQIVFDAGGQVWVASANGSSPKAIATGRLGRFDKLVSGQILFTHDVGPIDTHTQLWAATSTGAKQHMVADGNFQDSFTDMP